MRLRGIYAPLTTPFDHRGTIYWSKFDFNLSQLLRTKLPGFVVADRWGEAPLLSSEEKTLLWNRAAERAGKAAQVIAAVSGCGVQEARAQCRAAAEAGCSAALLEPPDLTAVAPGAGNWELFLRAVADSAELPVLADVRTGAPERPIRTRQIISLGSHPSIAGAVVEGHSESALQDARQACRPDFALITRDLQRVSVSLAGGRGAALLAVASAVPFYALSIEEAIRTRETSAAADLVSRALKFDRLVKDQGVPALKRALDERSFYGGPPRLPLVVASASTTEAVSQSLYELAS